MSINIMAPHSTCLALIKRSRRLIDQRFRCIVIQVSWHLYGHLENDKRLRRTFEDILLKTATSSISTFGGKSRHFFQVTKVPKAHCLKITEKVSFNFAMRSELNCSQTVLPDRSILIGHDKNEYIKCDIFGDFQTQWDWKTDSFSSKELFSQGAKHLRLLLLRDRQQSIQIQKVLNLCFTSNIIDMWTTLVGQIWWFMNYVCIPERRWLNLHVF